MNYKEALTKLQEQPSFNVEFNPKGQTQDGDIAMGIALSIGSSDKFKQIKTVGLGKNMKSAERKALVEAVKFIGL